MSNRGLPRLSQNGFALIAVMGLLLLLTILIAALVSNSQSRLQSAVLSLKSAQREATADATLQRAIIGLLASHPNDRWAADGRTRTISFEGTTAAVKIEDEGGKVDLNTAPPETLKRFFILMEVDEQKAIALSDRIADWRDADDDRRDYGAEAADYRIGGFTNGPANSLFHTTQEIRKVLEFPDDLFPCIAPYITVYSGSPRIVSRYAPAILQPLTDQKRGTQKSVVTGYGQGGAATGGRTFRISITLDLDNGNKTTRWTVIRLTEHPDDPYMVLDFGQTGNTSEPKCPQLNAELN